MFRFASIAALLGSAALPAQDPESAPNPFKPFDKTKFVEHVRGLGAGDEDIAAFETQCEEESIAYACESLLRKFHTGYDSAANLAEDGDPKAALELAALIEKGDDEYVRAHSRYHLGRHFLDGDDPDLATQVFRNYLIQDKNKTALDAEVAFFYGSALAEIPRPADAATTFADFLQLFPDAPERYRAVAAQRKAELEAQFESPLHQIADEMKGVGRNLRRGKTDKPVQTDQLEIVEQLQKIIEELEEQEKQSSGPASGNSKSNNPASQSALPGGQHRIGNLQDAPKVAKRWGDYKDRERKAIEADVQTRLSGPWKKMVEEYYKKLNRGGDQ